jgi:TonB family protein
MPRRTALVAVSIVGHLALGIGLYASGAWKLEKLDSDARMPPIGMMTPVLGGGGQQDLPKQEFKKKEKLEKKVAKDVQWEKRVEIDKPTKKLEETGEPGDGEGPGKGPGKGPGEIDGDVNGQCVLPPCGPAETKAEPIKLPDPPKAPVPLPPTVMGALRDAGDTQIHPSRAVQNQMLRDDNKRVVASIKVCIQASGAIGSVAMIGTSKYPEYDQQLVEAARRWHYRPYTVNGVPTPACSAVSFVYSIQ